MTERAKADKEERAKSRKDHTESTAEADGRGKDRKSAMGEQCISRKCDGE